MPARVIASPLAVEFIFPNATGWTARFDGLPLPDLARDLALGLAMNIHPHGTVKTRKTASNHVGALRYMVTHLAEAGFTGCAADLTRIVLLRYWLSCGYMRESLTRSLLRSFDAATGGLSGEAREQVNGRFLHEANPSQPRKPYTETEWQRLQQCCQQVIESSWSAHHDALALAQSGGDPQTLGEQPANLAWLLQRDGPKPTEHILQQLHHVGTWSSQRGRHHRIRIMREALFPDVDTVISYRLLFGVHTGIVPDGIDSLGLGDIDWAGDHTVLLSYLKGRTGPEGVVLPTRALRLLQRWLQHSAPLRAHAPQNRRHHLWMAAAVNSRGGNSWVAVPPFQDGLTNKWVARQGLLGDDGKPLSLHRSRIRTTYHNLLSRQGWTGRTAIDPNHTTRVEGDRYLTATTPAQLDAVETIIADGQNDLLRKALPPVVLSDAQTTQLVAEYPEAVSRLGLSGEDVNDLIGGRRDVFLAACADQLAGIHGPAGKPCPARPWVCLMCPLAVFLPRHAPNLLRLKAFFARQFQGLTTVQFQAVFGPYAHRLDTDILPRLDPAVLAAAACAVADTDSELPLRPEERTC